MIRFQIIYVIISIPVYLFLIYLKIRKSSNQYKYISLFFQGIFYLYICYVINYTILPVPINENYLSLVRPHTTFKQNINSNPLWLSSNFSITKEHVLNIIMTVPFGFIINYLIKIRKFEKMLILGLLLGICIEMLQLGISALVNYPYRTIDINDVIMNFLGVIIGFLIFKLISFLYIRIVDFIFTKYIYDFGKPN